MGNQREIRQFSPRLGISALISIRDGHATQVRAILGHDTAHFYMRLLPANCSMVLHNLDLGPVTLNAHALETLHIQSGGKMWCGYERFQEVLSELAPHLHDATFFVGDEVSRIDRFDIAMGELLVTCVHDEYWIDLEDYMRPLVQHLQTHPDSSTQFKSTMT